jgi:outer membrane PBP1 activator LpoA protein
MKLSWLRRRALACVVPLISAILLAGCDNSSSKDAAPGEPGKATAPGTKRLEEAKAKLEAQKKR